MGRRALLHTAGVRREASTVLGLSVYLLLLSLFPSCFFSFAGTHDDDVDVECKPSEKASCCQSSSIQSLVLCVHHLLLFARSSLAPAPEGRGENTFFALPCGSYETNCIRRRRRGAFAVQSNSRGSDRGGGDGGDDRRGAIGKQEASQERLLRGLGHRPTHRSLVRSRNDHHRRRPPRALARRS